MAKLMTVDLVITDKQITLANRDEVALFVDVVNDGSLTSRDLFDVDTYTTRITARTSGRGAQFIWGAYKELIK